VDSFCEVVSPLEELIISVGSTLYIAGKPEYLIYGRLDS
jgi:hypothetical protein